MRRGRDAGVHVCGGDWAVGVAVGMDWVSTGTPFGSFVAMAHQPAATQFKTAAAVTHCVVSQHHVVHSRVTLHPKNAAVVGDPVFTQAALRCCV